MSKKKIIILLLIYAFLTKFFVSIYSIRYARYLTNFDGAIQYLIGREVIRGQVLYKDIFDQKTPYIFFITGLASLIDYHHIGLFVFEVAVLFSDLWFIYKFLVLFYNYNINIDNPNVKNTAETDNLLVILYAVLGSLVMAIVLCFQPFNFGYNKTESYAVCFMLPAFYLFAKYYLNVDKGDIEFKPKDMFYIGICASMAFMTNIRAVVIFVPPAIVVAYILLKNKQYKNLLQIIGMGLFGFVLTIVPYIIYMLVTDSYADMVYALVDANINYAKSNNIDKRDLYGNLLYSLNEFGVFFIVLGTSTLVMILDKYDKYLKIGTVGSLAAGMSYIMISNRTSNYYFMTILPYLLPLYIICTKLFTKGYKAFYKFIKYDRKNEIFKYYPISLAIILLVGHTLYYQNNLYFSDYSSLEKAAEFKRAVVTNFGSIDKLKILSYGFGMDVYMYLDARIHYKYFFIPSISYFVDSKAYDAQKSYIAAEDPDVFIYRGDAINSELPKAELEDLMNLINEKYVIVDTVLTSEEDPDSIPHYIMGRRRDFAILDENNGSAANVKKNETVSDK